MKRIAFFRGRLAIHAARRSRAKQEYLTPGERDSSWLKYTHAEMMVEFTQRQIDRLERELV